MGQSPPGSSYNKDGKGVPLINGASDFEGKKIKPIKFCTKPTKISEVGDILICIRATIGNITISDGEYCLGRGVAAIRAFDKKVNPILFIQNAGRKNNSTISVSKRVYF